MRYGWTNTVNEIGEFGAIRHNRDRRLRDVNIDEAPELKALFKAIPDKRKRARMRKAARAVLDHIKENPDDNMSAVLDAVVKETSINRSSVREAISILLHSRTVSISQNNKIVLARSAK